MAKPAAEAKELHDKQNDRMIPGGPEALQAIEEAREAVWERPTFAGQLFLGRVLTRLIFPYAVQSEEDKRVGDAFCEKLEAFLKQKVDPDAIDRTGDLPDEVIEGLAKLGCFGMKIPKEYGGLGFSQVNYNRAIALVGSYCSSTAVWLSAHQSIGVPQPLKMFGTDQQKRKYLPLFAKGAISAFALTEPDVGSDPANMSTTATPVDGGSAYLINGRKLWCTNGPVADVMVVMARTPDVMVRGKPRKQITAFIVEKGMPGIRLVHRCQFMGIRGIQNGLLEFKDVRVPKENIIWDLGKGLKVALMTLNTGRLTLPAGCLGGAKRCLQIVRRWAQERKQWGGPIGGHEAVATMMGWMTAHTFAMEAVVWLTSAWADKGQTDIRLEAAFAKLFGSEVSWTIADQTVQIRGGRGFESADSLKGRGEEPIPAERILRDARINRIIEGTSEIMHLFLAREALDPHIQLAFDMILPNRSVGQRVKAAVTAAGFYAIWYPKLWLPVLGNRPAGLPPQLRGHWGFVLGGSRRLARVLFHKMMRYQQKLDKRQAMLARLVDIGMDLFVMAASISRAAMMRSQDSSTNAVELADLFCRYARRRIDANFASLDIPEDRQGYRVAQDLMKGNYTWLESGIVR
ncbi:MAG: acyl-CoA dehydrogenase family protein [Candidatus Omnitrophica bacterium]|nr:acyl-CoA dehydrogenase family protein [Candidatus Omnitrophota bacterium]